MEKFESVPLEGEKLQTEGEQNPLKKEGVSTEEVLNVDTEVVPDEKDISYEVFEGADPERIREAIDGIEQIKNQTDRIESKLEKTPTELEEDKKQPENKQDVSKSIQEQKPPSKLKKLFRIIVAGLAIGGGSILANQGKETYEKYTEQKQVEQDRENLRMEVVHKTGIDLMTFAEQNGFEVSVDVDNGAGEYIVHIGQTHDRPEFLTRLMGKDLVIESQKKIQNLLNLVLEADPSLVEVFNEGVDIESVNNFEIVKKYIEKVENMKCTVATFDVLHVQYLDFGIVEGGFNALIKKSIVKKLQEIKGEFEKNNIKFQSDLEKEYFVESLGVFMDTAGLFTDLVYEDDAELAYGAVEKMSIEGKFKIGATESKWLNDDANQAIANTENIKTEYYKATTDDERKYLSIKWKEAEKEFWKHALEPRENFAVRHIANKMSNDTQRLNMMVYGDAHEFNNNVEDWNKKNPDRKIGLIRLKPKA